MGMVRSELPGGWIYTLLGKKINKQIKKPNKIELNEEGLRLVVA